MRLIIEPSYDLLSQWAANYVAKRINEFGPKESTPFVLGLPTGSSPLGMYKALIQLCKEGKVSFRNVVTFNMDEYVGLAEDHPESYHSFMWTRSRFQVFPSSCTWPSRSMVKSRVSWSTS